MEARPRPDISREIVTLRSEQSAHLHFSGQIRITVLHGAVTVLLVGCAPTSHALDPGEIYYTARGRHLKLVAATPTQVCVERCPGDVNAIFWAYRHPASVSQ